jgi:limonene-1,2-epoxide hydrolase
VRADDAARAAAAAVWSRPTKEATMTRSSRTLFLIATLMLSTGAASAQEANGYPCSPAGVVRAFLASFSTRDASVVASFLADDLVYNNTGLPTILGKASAEAFMAQFLPLFSYAQFEEQSLMADGHEILMRRVEHYTISLQAPIGYLGVSFDLPVMGRYIVRDCKISEWSDYWNTGQFTSLSGIPMGVGP